MPNQILATGKPNILITGAAGFLGSNLAEELVKTGNIIAIDNFITGNEKNIDLLLRQPGFEFIKHDITTPLDLANYPELKKFQINVQGIQYLYHFACPTSPKDHQKLSLEIIAANAIGTQNMLELAKKYQSTFIHVSSQHIYGHPESNQSIQENYIGRVDPIGSRSAYDEGKRFAETIVYNYTDKFKLNTRIARLFTVYGPKMAINDGRAVPDFIFNALNNQDIIIYGDQTTENTFCYVTDITDALIKLAKSSLNTPVNLGHYQKQTLTSVAELIIKLTGSSSTIVYEKPQWQSVSYNIPDIALAKEKLGWFPMANLKDGLEQTIEYMKANLRTYQV